MSQYCTKDECRFQGEDRQCLLGECVYYKDPDDIGDEKYHAVKDEGEL